VDEDVGLNRNGLTETLMGIGFSNVIGFWLGIEAASVSVTSTSSINA